MHVSGLPPFMNAHFFGNSVTDYAISAGIILLGFLCIRILREPVFNRLKRLTEKTASDFDDRILALVKAHGVPLLYLIVAYFALQHLVFSKSLSRVLTIGGTVLATFFAVRTVLGLLRLVIDRWWKKQGTDANGSKALSGVFTGLQVVVWGIALVALLDNLGFKIGTLVAGLGIGGVALALASQALLADLFSYFAILFDRPFEIGDFIVVGEFQGTVEHIGVKTTRLRSIGGEEISFCNSDLLGSRSRNYKRMGRRRVLFTFEIRSDTPTDTVKRVPSMVKEIVCASPETSFERAHFKEFRGAALVFEVVYHITGSDFILAMDIQQSINIAIKEAFAKENIAFALPAQTVHLANADTFCMPARP